MLPVPSEQALWIRRLGFAGLLPFYALAALVWVVPGLNWPAQLLLLYCGMIFCFVGAVHFGAALFNAAMPRGGVWWSIMPAVAAAPILLTPPVFGLPLVAGGLILAWSVDQTMLETVLPLWYRQLRDYLTAGAVLALILGWLGAIQIH